MKKFYLHCLFDFFLEILPSHEETISCNAVTCNAVTSTYSYDAIGRLENIQMTVSNRFSHHRISSSQEQSIVSLIDHQRDTINDFILHNFFSDQLTKNSFPKSIPSVLINLILSYTKFKTCKMQSLAPYILRANLPEFNKGKEKSVDSNLHVRTRNFQNPLYLNYVSLPQDQICAPQLFGHLNDEKLPMVNLIYFISDDSFAVSGEPKKEIE